MATFSSGAGYYTLILNANEVGGSADVGSNTSKVSWSLQMRADSAYCQWNPGPGDFEVWINGGLVWSAQNPSLWYGGMGGTLTLASGTTTVGHNSDGSKTVYCEGKYIANSTANYLPNSSTCGGNLGLTTIPRASSFSSITGNTIGGSQTINIDRKSSSFTHNLWYRIGSGSWVSIATGVGTSKTWTLPKSLNNQIPNTTSLTLTYLLRTYNGGSQIGGDVTYNFKVNYSGEKPTAGSVSITYANLFNNKFIANYSTATIKYSGYAGVYGSTVKSAQVIFNGSWRGTATYNTGKLTTGTHRFQGIVTDSRNNSSYTSQQSFTCYQINNPTISINAYRSDSSGNANPSGTYITIIPTYSAHNPVGGNSIKSSSFTCSSLMTTGTAIGSGTKKILSGAKNDSEYVISGTVTDQLGRSSVTSIKIGTAFAIWDVRPDEKGMAFGKYSTGANKFEVAWDAYFDKKIEAELGVFNNHIVTNKGMYVKNVSAGSGSVGYVLVAEIKIKNSYANSPIIFEISRRGQAEITRVHISFLNDIDNDPGLAYGYIQGGSLLWGGVYIHKKTSGVWDLYVKKNESYDGIGVTNVKYDHSYMDGKIDIAYPATFVSSLPSGYQALGFRNYDIFPVGAVYISVTSTNPSTYFGGTWVQFGQGKTLVGVNTSDEDFNTVEKTGGTKRRPLAARIGAFDSDIGKIGYAAMGNPSGGGFTYGIAGSAFKDISGNRVNHNTIVVDNIDGKDPSIVQPYVTVYFWKRTA